jgi:Clp protease
VSQHNPTQDRHGGRWPARRRQTLGGRPGGPVSGLLHHHQGHDLERVRKDTERNYWMSASEAIDYGLAYKIISSMEELG